jgi:uroporphyrinogen decarboxylase
MVSVIDRFIFIYFLLQCIFPKGGHFSLEQLSTAGYDIIGLDWTIKPDEGRQKVGSNITVQGNMDPCALYGPKVKRYRLIASVFWNAS